jgi:hypothetical protein
MAVLPIGEFRRLLLFEPQSGEEDGDEQKSGDEGRREQLEIVARAIGRRAGRKDASKASPEVARIGSNGWSDEVHGKTLMALLPCLQPQ